MSMIASQPHVRFKLKPETENFKPKPFHKGTEDSAGFDIVAPGEYVIPKGGNVIIHTGIFLEIPRGWFGQINPRSSLASKHSLMPGARVIDSDYRGELMIDLHNEGREDYIVNPGDRIAQIIFMPVLTAVKQVDFDTEFESTERDAGGFGSTGKN